MKFFYIIIMLTLFSCQTGQRKRRADDYHAIGISFLNKCNSPQALGQLKKAVAHQPRNSFIRYTLGSTYFLMQKYALARVEFQKALEFNPNLTEALVSLAVNDIELNQTERALKNLKLAEADLSYTKASYIISYRGYAYFKQKNYKEAQKNFKKIYKESKNNLCFNYLYLGKSEFYLKNYKEAERILKKSVFYCQKETQNQRICRHKPHSFEEHYFLGQIYKILKLKQKVKYHFKIFLKRAPSSHPYFSIIQKEFKH